MFSLLLKELIFEFYSHDVAPLVPHCFRFRPSLGSFNKENHVIVGQVQCYFRGHKTPCHLFVGTLERFLGILIGTRLKVLNLRGIDILL